MLAIGVLTTVQGKFHPTTDIGKTCGMKGMCVHCMHLVGMDFVHGFSAGSDFSGVQKRLKNTTGFA